MRKRLSKSKHSGAELTEKSSLTLLSKVKEYINLGFEFEKSKIYKEIKLKEGDAKVLLVENKFIVFVRRTKNKIKFVVVSLNLPGIIAMDEV